MASVNSRIFKKGDPDLLLIKKGRSPANKGRTLIFRSGITVLFDKIYTKTLQLENCRLLYHNSKVFNNARVNQYKTFSKF